MGGKGEEMREEKEVRRTRGEETKGRRRMRLCEMQLEEVESFNPTSVRKSPSLELDNARERRLSILTSRM